MFPWYERSSSATTFSTSASVMSVYPTISVLLNFAGGGASRGCVAKIPDEAYSCPPKEYSRPCTSRPEWKMPTPNAYA